MQLVVVESPKKAKTIGGFLGPGYRVAASFGHVRDLPPRDLGVDVQRSFRPQYVTLPRARQAIGSLKRAAADAQSVLLATDPDREGEAIAWHVATALALKRGQYWRVAFHELSRHAVQAALAAPRDLDQRLIDSQQARRVLDRLVGYQLSPLLWRKVARGTSAGRVQSVAVRLIVDREREIRAFVPVEYWTIDVALRPVGEQDDANSFVARLLEVDGKKAHIPDEQTALVLSTQLQAAGYRVRDTQRRQTQKPPAPPFTTSTLQQAAASRLRFPAKKTMACAQALFEDGLITYHRTDSVVVSGDAIAATRERIAAEFGTDYLPRSPRRYVTRAKNAQEAHEAIRPVDIARTPLVLRAQLPPDEWRIYDLVWKRMLASQMASARYQVDTLRVAGWWPASRVSGVGGQGSETADQARTGDSHFSRHSAPLTQHPSERTFALAAQATLLLFPGWLALYGRDAGETGAADGRAPAGAGSRRRRGASATEATAEKPTGDGVAEGEPADEVASAAPRENLRLPQLDDSTPVEALRVNPAQHFTQPPRRYTEAGLIKTLEEAGVGRPSTYAAIVSTIQDRSYVAREQGHFVPTELGFVANDFLVEHFPRIVDLPFTARMEDELDEIASGQRPWVEMLSAFYGPFSQTVAQAQTAPITALKAAARARAIEAQAAVERAAAGGPACPECGKPLIEKTGRFGSFFGCSGYPRCRYIHRQPKEPLPAVGTCPECGNALVERHARRTGKPFIGCSGYPACRYIQGRPPHERVSGGNGQAGDPAQPGDRSVPAYARGRRPAIRTPRRAAGARRWQPRRGTARAMEAPGQPRTRTSS